MLTVRTPNSASVCGTHELPRERLIREGGAALSDSEVLALILGSGHASTGDARAIAQTLIARFGDLRGVVCAGHAELFQMKGVGDARAARILAAGELARRVASERLERGIPVTSSIAVYEHLGPLMRDERREIFWALLLDTRNRLITALRISAGSLAASLVHPREAFRPAIREAAAAVLFAHNHPSGDPTPSREDRRITARLREAGVLLGIPVLDHIVIGAESYFSFADAGWPCSGE